MSTIDALYDDLQDKLKQRPDSTILQSTLEYLSQARVGLTSGNLHTFLEQLRSYLDKLEEEGLWEWTPEKERLLQDLVYELAKIPPSQEPVRPHTPSVSSEASSSHENDTSISSGPIVAPPPPAPTFPHNTLQQAELAHALNQIWILHRLSTEPDTIVPPGKSLLSVTINPEAYTDNDPMAPLRSQVENVVYKAFWDEVKSILISSSPLQ